jgi:hypothetical protein
MPVLSEYDYVFAIGTMFALLEAYNNGASTSSLPTRAFAFLHIPVLT